jgi:CheY-like chemotaxis protein
MDRGVSVLVVDDDPSIREFVAAALGYEGYCVLTAPDGLAALELADRHWPALVLLDMRMPVLDGWGFAEAYLDRRGPRAPVGVMTAAEDAAAWAEEVGAEGVLSKPFGLEDLLAVVERHRAAPA